MKPLPIMRRSDVIRGEIYWLPTGSKAVDLRNGKDVSLLPGIYVHTSDERSDDEIRKAVGA